MTTVFDASEIIPGLYIGAESAARQTEELKSRNITHILTVNQYPLPLEMSRSFKYKFIQGLDIECTDLFCYFEECFDFIEEGIEEGGVLVHCLVGCSRSATIVIAYLMNKRHRGFGEILGFVRQKRSTVWPNEGFKTQLLMFESMGCKMDKQSDIYRKYKWEKLALKMQNASPSHRGFMADDDRTVSPEQLRENPNEEILPDDVIFKCRKCRQALFKKSGVMGHTVGVGEIAFDWRKKATDENKSSSDTEMEELCDRSLFIEPVRWMADSIQIPQGKLSCLKCGAKIGSFIWYGERCPCGAWIAPAFHIQTSKVDETKPRLQLPGIKVS
ncbi:hypothetical protein FSP39_008761 [Pinctada imbricata]|uniref:Protein-tyrosine-phosphatase n=1 Tax=Pinctada imbricata TaxID=66713 RepID=A0AA88XUL6_PINIB|nr:hypothetical protein FSP39_008761 [Pinctada imbricata]